VATVESHSSGFFLKVLALDASTEYCSVALLADGATTSHEVLAGQQHSQFILPMVRQALAEGELSLAQLDGIAFGAGPGSFTGLRIACGVAQGLAFGASLPVAGICTLEALAQEAGGGSIIAALDARMSQIYHAAYEEGPDGWQPVTEPALCFPQDAPPVPPGNWTGCGSGFEMYDQVLRTRYDKSIQRIVSGLRPQARSIAQLALPRFARGEGTDPADAMPLYIRNKVALKEKER
jgi:tRNA threonylcarbamoyladenosine biosynthesis protein TsaB